MDRKERRTYVDIIMEELKIIGSMVLLVLTIVAIVDIVTG